jgi:hypothetical protein
MEKLEADGAAYHKNCFRCKECNKAVSVGSYAALQGKIYCTVLVFRQEFTLEDVIELHAFDSLEALP